MKTDALRFPGKIVWVLFFFLTILLIFPFFYYYRFSTINSDFLEDSRLRISQFGMDLKSYLEQAPFTPESAERTLQSLPLTAGSTVILYDRAGSLIAERHSPGYTEFSGNFLPYTAARRIVHLFRKTAESNELKTPRSVREKLLRQAFLGQRGADDLFLSDRIGDRILYLSFPVFSYSGKEKTVEGAFLLEYSDPSLSVLLQKHRGQLAVTGFLFGLLLAGYLGYVLAVLVFPLKKLLRNLISVNNRTDYLLSDQDRIRTDSGIGEFTRQLDGVTGLLKQSEQEMEQYAAELRHIIRNPLANIKIALDGLLIGRNTAQDQSFSGIIQNNLSRIDRYLERYPVLSAAETTGVPAENLNINQFLRGLLINYKPLAQQKHIRLILHDSGNPVWWKGFPAYLSSVCEQVFTNAIDFSPANSCIACDISVTGKKICISIADHGPGIPAGKEEVIFRRYASFRKHSDKTHTGTGLYLAKRMLQKIGGSITAENGLYGGAVFKITLPTGI